MDLKNKNYIYYNPGETFPQYNLNSVFTDLHFVLSTLLLRLGSPIKTNCQNDNFPVIIQVVDSKTNSTIREIINTEIINLVKEEMIKAKNDGNVKSMNDENVKLINDGNVKSMNDEMTEIGKFYRFRWNKSRKYI